MPAWEGQLDPGTLRALAYYVHQMGGGEPDAPSAAAAVEPTQGIAPATDAP